MLVLASLLMLFSFNGMGAYTNTPSIYHQGEFVVGSSYYSDQYNNSTGTNLQAGIFPVPANELQISLSGRTYSQTTSFIHAESLFVGHQPLFTNYTGYFYGFGVSENYGNSTIPNFPINQLGFAWSAGVEARVGSNIYITAGYHNNNPEAGIAYGF